MDGVRGRDLALTLTDFVGEYNGKPGACPMGPDIVPVFSEDGEHWRGVPEVTWDDRAKEATIRLRPERDTVWIAHQPPYTPRRLARLLEQVDRCDDARIEVIGKTVRGRDLHLVTVTDADVPDRDKVTVWLQARQHAWESGTSFVMEGALRFVTSDDPDARSLRRRVVFKFTPMVDPDGCAAGQVRFNANGYDVNRHWDEVDLRRKRFLTLMPEIWYVKKAICSARRRGAEGPPAGQPAQHGDRRVPPDDGGRRRLAGAGREAERPARPGGGLPPEPGSVFGAPARRDGERAPRREGGPRRPDGAADREGPEHGPSADDRGPARVRGEAHPDHGGDRPALSP